MAKKVATYAGPLPAVLKASDKQLEVKGWIKTRDTARGALGPGKRISKTRSIYYETRKNRSDMPGKKI